MFYENEDIVVRTVVTGFLKIIHSYILIFDIVSYPKEKLSASIAIDEFKGNTWKDATTKLKF